MKKVLLIIVLMMVCSNVYAYDFEYKLVDNKYVLSIIDNGIEIDYKDAKDQFALDDYMIYTIDNKDYYFYLGNEITYDEYNEIMEKKELERLCDKQNDYCAIVSSTDEIINTINNLFNQSKNGKYYLWYTSYDYKKIDFDKINEFYKKEFMSDIDKNMYKYDEYYLFKPDKFLPIYDENKIIIDFNMIKTNSEEVTKVDLFLKEFLKLFDGKSDYEKILGVYTYINNTAKYMVDDGYINFMDGELSAYDVLIKHKTVCIGNATTFQLLMEKLGIESYIIDHVGSKSDSEYVTTHTYNIVKLDGEWYIVDIAFDDQLSGLLMGMSDNYSLEDFKYYDIKIADKSYFATHDGVSKDFAFDYSKLLDLTNSIDKKDVIKDEVKEDDKKSYIKEYILIGIILLVIIFIIWLFTRKK